MNLCHPRGQKLVSFLNLARCKHTAPQLFGEGAGGRGAQPSHLQPHSRSLPPRQCGALSGDFKPRKVSRMVNRRRGLRRAATQNKLARVWLRLDSISVYVTERERAWEPGDEIKNKEEEREGGREGGKKMNRPVYLVGGCRGNSACMQINSTLSIGGRMQPFCLQSGEEETLVSQSLFVQKRWANKVPELRNLEDSRGGITGICPVAG